MHKEHEHLENLRARIMEEYADVIGLNGFVRLNKTSDRTVSQGNIRNDLLLYRKAVTIERYAEDYLDHVEDSEIRDIYQEAHDNAVHFEESFIKLLKNLKLLK